MSFLVVCGHNDANPSNLSFAGCASWWERLNVAFGHGS